MKFHSLIIDDFLSDPNVLRQHALQAEFKNEQSPFDEVIYPGICRDIPQDISTEVYLKVSDLMKTVMLRPNATFMRLSAEGVKAPHQAHTDQVCGDFTFLLYLNKEEDCQGGTSIVEHANGMRKAPLTEEEGLVWNQDANNYYAWNQMGFCPMKYNRAFIIDSYLFHRAEPVEGFGQSVEDGRLVLISFFDIIN